MCTCVGIERTYNMHLLHIRLLGEYWSVSWHLTMVRTGCIEVNIFQLQLLFVGVFPLCARTKMEKKTEKNIDFQHLTVSISHPTTEYSIFFGIFQQICLCLVVKPFSIWTLSSPRIAPCVLLGQPKINIIVLASIWITDEIICAVLVLTSISAPGTVKFR